MSDKAWFVSLNDGNTTVFAATAAEAKMKAVKRWWDAYGKEQGWPVLLTARRLVELDGRQQSKEVGK
jgi:hypothetical protein